MPERSPGYQVRQRLASEQSAQGLLQSIGSTFFLAVHFPPRTISAVTRCQNLARNSKQIVRIEGLRHIAVSADLLATEPVLFLALCRSAEERRVGKECVSKCRSR